MLRRTTTECEGPLCTQRSAGKWLDYALRRKSPYLSKQSAYSAAAQYTSWRPRYADSASFFSPRATMRNARVGGSCPPSWCSSTLASAAACAD